MSYFISFGAHIAKQGVQTGKTRKIHGKGDRNIQRSIVRQELNPVQLTLNTLKKELAKYFSTDTAATLKNEFVDLPNLNSMSMPYLAAAVYMLSQMPTADNPFISTYYNEETFLPLTQVFRNLSYDGRTITPELIKKRKEVLISYIMLIVSRRRSMGIATSTDYEDMYEQGDASDGIALTDTSGLEIPFDMDASAFE